MASTMSEFATATKADRSTTVLARFTTAPTVTNEQYDECIRRLEGTSEWPPDGLALHVAFRSGGNFRVSELWDSQEQFEESVKRLMPVLSEVGIELSGEPEMLEVHNIIQR